MKCDESYSVLRIYDRICAAVLKFVSAGVAVLLYVKGGSGRSGESSGSLVDLGVKLTAFYLVVHAYNCK